MRKEVRKRMPLIEFASKFEFKNQPENLLKKLGVPEPIKIWWMFRHGLLHSIRPYYIKDEGEILNWGISYD